MWASFIFFCFIQCFFYFIWNKFIGFPITIFFFLVNCLCFSFSLWIAGAFLVLYSVDRLIFRWFHSVMTLDLGLLSSPIVINIKYSNLPHKSKQTHSTTEFVSAFCWLYDLLSCLNQIWRKINSFFFQKKLSFIWAALQIEN